MGLVKFGQLTLNVAEVPDGHIVVSESELSQMRQGANAYALLKSKIPLSVTDDQLTSVIEKGQRFDTLAQQLEQQKTVASQLQSKVDSFANLPKDFTAERYVQLENAEKVRQRMALKDSLTQKVLKTVEEKMGVKVAIDERFIPRDVLENFDFSAKDAEDKWAIELDKAHTAQEDFIKNQTQGLPTAVSSGAPANFVQPPPAGVHQGPGPKDVVSSAGAAVQSF